MLYTFLRLMANQPQLLSEHAQAYAELVSAEMASASAFWKRQAWLNALAVCCLGVAGVLVGVALMLWAVTPVGSIHAPWALIVAPLLPIAVALGCLMQAQKSTQGGALERVRQQLRADLLVLREAARS